MRGSGARTLVAVLAVLVLVGLVAVAATGSTPGGTSRGRAPADALLDTLFSLALLALIPGAVLLVYGLMQRKEIAREVASGRYRRMGLGSYLLFMALFTLAVYFRLSHSRFSLGGAEPGGEVGAPNKAAAPEGDIPPGRVYEPEFAWIPVLAVVALVATAIVAYVLVSRRNRRLATVEERAAAHVAETLEDTLDDLRAEPDPRRAVIAAFARLERALAASGLPRRSSETAKEYVARILDRLDVDGAAVRTLTDLFETAKFSQHLVDEGMRTQAIEALTRIRDDLREAALRRQAEEERRALRAREGATSS